MRNARRSGSEIERTQQLSYSEIQCKTRDEQKRQQKAAKISAVTQHFLGRTTLTGLVALDVGCSTGFTAAALSEAGATVIGMDIDSPGLRFARDRFGDRATFVRADGSRLPLKDDSIDVAVFNHIYEHVVDPDAVMREIVRVLRPDGIAYLGFGNRYSLVEPHYRLPFLSWLPRRAADRYVALSGRASTYYEQFRTRRQLIRMCHGLAVWDYTYTVLTDPETFQATDMVGPRLARVHPAVWHALTPIMPTFIWIGTPGSASPRGPLPRVVPVRVRRHRDV